MNKFASIFRRVFKWLFAVLFVLFFAVSACLSTVAFSFSDPAALADSVVNGEYLSIANALCRESFEDLSLMYGVPEEVLAGVLEAEAESISAFAKNGVKDLLAAVFAGEEYVQSEFDAAPFVAEINAYVAGLNGVDVAEETVTEIASDCADVISSCYSPIREGIFREVFDGVLGKIPKVVYSLASTVVFVLDALTVIFFVAA
ncbi:MAG: hypothetical protein IKT43_01025, partial [Clostridia bacterium]|nr:hypothetical protein [Clostridia bacterium]